MNETRYKPGVAIAQKSGGLLARYLRASRVPFVLAAVASAYAVLADVATEGAHSGQVGLNAGALVAIYFVTATAAGCSVPHFVRQFGLACDTYRALHVPILLG
jgi:hypothetical protein